MNEPHENLLVVKMDRDWHPNGVESKAAELHFAALDTAYKLLSEYAVRVAMESIRTAVNAIGGHMGSDAEVFAESADSGLDNAARSYTDLAPHDMAAAGQIAHAFETLIDQVVSKLAANLGLIIEGDR